MDDLAPEEAMVERLLERLETGIESAVSQERFKEASALRDEISRMHMDDTSAVLKVNSGMQIVLIIYKTLVLYQMNPNYTH